MAGLFDRAAVVKPAQLLQAVVVGLARQVIEGVAQEVDVAALEGGLGQDLADGRAQACMIVGDDQLDAVEAAFALLTEVETCAGVGSDDFRPEFAFRQVEKRFAGTMQRHEIIGVNLL